MCQTWRHATLCSSAASFKLSNSSGLRIVSNSIKYLFIECLFSTQTDPFFLLFLFFFLSRYDCGISRSRSVHHHYLQTRAAGVSRQVLRSQIQKQGDKLLNSEVCSCQKKGFSNAVYFLCFKGESHRCDLRRAGEGLRGGRHHSRLNNEDSE